MPVWRAKIGFHDPGLTLGDQDYSFNIHVVAASTSAAWARAENVATALLDTVMPTTVTCTSIGVSNPDVVNGTLIIPQSSAGTREVTGLAIPGWNVAEIKMALNTGIRAHTWYIRMGLTEDDILGQSLAGAVQTSLTDLVSGLLAINACCDKDGAVFAVGDISGVVHMRQMSWRRRTRPGYHRGWVPNA